jgi:uncharacterized membrane protein YbhN (UPF0104 family)
MVQNRAEPRSDPEVAADKPSPAGASSLLTRRVAWLLGLMRSKVIRIGFLAFALALLALALVDESNSLLRQVERLSVPIVLLALALNYCGLMCSLMVWRELLADLGSRLSVAEAWRIMFIGQLAKYIPGSLWPVLAQAELGHDRGIPRSRSALSVLLSYAVMTCSGVVVAAVTLPFATAASVLQYLWIVLLVPVAAVLLSPPVLNRLLRLVLRLAHRGPLEQGVSYTGLARTMGWAVAGWLCNGAVVYVLMRQLSGLQQGTLLGRRVRGRLRPGRDRGPRGGDGGDPAHQDDHRDRAHHRPGDPGDLGRVRRGGGRGGGRAGRPGTAAAAAGRARRRRRRRRTGHTLDEPGTTSRAGGRSRRPLSRGRAAGLSRTAHTPTSCAG